MTSLPLAQAVDFEDRSRAGKAHSLTPEKSAARAIVVALERVRVTGLPVEMRHADYAPLSGVELLELAEAVGKREQAPVRIRWTDSLDGFLFEPEAQPPSARHAA